MAKTTVWTKKNVEKMTGEELRIWNNKCIETLNDADRLKVTVPATEKAYKLIQAEMTRRNKR